MRKIAVLAVTALLLSGCMSTDEIATRECQRLGLAPGTPPFANCFEQSLARQDAHTDAVLSRIQAQ